MAACLNRTPLFLVLLVIADNVQCAEILKTQNITENMKMKCQLVILLPEISHTCVEYVKDNWIKLIYKQMYIDIYIIKIDPYNYMRTHRIHAMQDELYSMN